MADRRTKIILDLDEGPYKRGLAQASAATKAFARELDTSNDRMSMLVQTSLALGPSLVPIGAAAVPAIAGLSTGLGVAAGAASVAVLAFGGLGDAVKALNEYQLDPTKENLKNVREAMGALGPAGRDFARFIQDLRPEMQELQDVAQAGLFPGLQEGIEHLLDRGPQVKRIIDNIATTMGDLADEAGSGLAGWRWDNFFNYIETEARPIMQDFGRSIGNLAEGLGNMLVGLDPLTDQFADGLLKMSRNFAEWSRDLEDSPGFQGFVDYVKRVSPEVVDTIGALAVALGDIVVAAAPVGEASLPIIRALAHVLSAIAESPAGPILIGTAAAMSTLSRSVALYNAASGSALLGMLRGVRTEGKGAENGAKGAARGIGGLVGAIGGFSLGTVTSEMTDLGREASTTENALGVLGYTGTGALIGFGVGGPVGAAIGGAVGLVGSLGTALFDSDEATEGLSKAQQAALPHIDELTSSLSRQTGQLTKQTRNLLVKAGSEAGAYELADELGISVGLLTKALQGNKHAVDELDQQTQGWNFTTDAQRDAAKDLRDIVLDSNDTLDDAQKRQQLVAEGLRKTRRQTRNAAEATRDLNEIFDKVPDQVITNLKVSDASAAVEIVDRLRKKYDLTPREVRTVLRAADFASDDIGRIMRDLNEIPRERRVRIRALMERFDISRKEARELERTISDIPGVASTTFRTPGLDKADRDVFNFDKIVDALNPFHNTKIDTPGSGKAQNEVSGLQRLLATTPTKHDVNTKAPGAKQAADDIDKVAKRIANLPKRFVSNLFLDANAKDTIADVTKIFDKLNPFNADGRIWDFYAGGGIRENHIAQIAPAGAMRIWAEPETEGEAYIPFARSKRQRSRAIADETVDRLGGRVLWNRDGAAYTNVSAPTAMPVSLSSEHARIESMYADIVTEFGRGLGDAVEFALSQMPSGFSWPLPRQYQPSGTWGTYASGGSHPALDWPAPNGTPIYPVMPGRVMHTTSLGSSYGNYTEIDHGQGLTSLYAHQLGFRTRAGETVFPGQTIGLVDSTGNSTGPHLHLELQRNGTSFDYTSMLTGGGASMGILGIAGQYHGDHSGLDRASPSVAQSYAHSVMGRWGWSEFHWPYWLDLGNRESGWRWNARNQSSGAYGIPQSLPPEKLAASGPDWRTNAGTQIDWMGNYIAERYGSPYKAIGWHNANNWYGDGGIQLFDSGGVWRHGQLGINLSGRDEYVNDPQATAAAIRMADGGIVDELARVLGGFNYGPGVRPPRRRRDETDTPDITRRAQRQLMRAERHLSRTTALFARRSQEEKAAKRRVDRAQKALDDAKGKAEKKEAKVALDDAKNNLELAEKRAERSGKARRNAEKDLDKAQQDIRDARADQKVLDKAVRGFDLRGGMGRSDVRAEFRELLAGVRQTMGKDSLLYRALKRMGDRAADTAKRLDDERKEREKLTERLRSLRQASNQYESSVRNNFRNDPFTGGLDEFALQVRADRNDAKSMKAALNRARRKGLSGGLFRQLAASGNLELAQQFGRLDRGEIRRYERLFEQRQKTSAALGDRAAEIVYGKRLDRATRATERQARVIERLQRKLDRIEDRVGDRIEAGARRGVRDGMNGRKKKLHQFVMEARS